MSRKFSYEDVIKKENVIKQVQCNKCGAQIEVIHNYGMIPHDVFENYCHFEMLWDSMKNPKRKHKNIESFDLCENCYNKFVDTFAIPVSLV